MNVNCNNIDDLLLEGDPRSMELAAESVMAKTILRDRQKAAPLSA